MNYKQIFNDRRMKDSKVYKIKVHEPDNSNWPTLVAEELGIRESVIGEN
jgi:hypothetical protein